MAAHENPVADELAAQGRALRGLARAILRDTDGADDVVQDAFAAALAARPAVNRDGWLVRVVQNLARRRLRDRARRRRRHEDLPPPASLPAPDDLLARVELHRLVADAVLRLGEPYRETLVLRYWQDVPPRAIARRLGVPVATVKTRLQRGLSELRRRLDRRTGDRRAWLAALVPAAHPKLLAAASASSLLGPTTIAALAAMNTKHLTLLAAACLCVGVAVWQPWRPRRAPPADGGPAIAARDAGAGTTPGEAAGAPANSNAAAAARRAAIEPAERTCTVVGRILTYGDVPAADGRIRLIHLWSPDSPPPSATTAADGTFALQVPRPHAWIPYSFVLADAPGWAVRELHLGQRVQESIAGDRLDLGTLRLERGVAVHGRVAEADDSPLRARARLLVWDPARSGSWTAMYGGRAVGVVELGGRFALADRLSAGENGTLMLAAVSESGVGWTPLEFAAGQQRLDPVEIRLLPGGRVGVRVVDAEARPLAGARVTATPYFAPIGLAPMWEPASASSPPRFAEAEALFARHTDEVGTAHFQNLPRRQHPAIREANLHQRPVEAIILTAEKSGYVTATATVDPAVPDAAPVTITLRSQRRVAFHGTVATADGTALPGVTVRLNGGDASALTDAAGRYELPERHYQQDRAWFVVEGGGVPLTHAQADIPPAGDRVAHDFTVELRARVTGRVVDQRGEPVAGVALHLGVPGGVHYPSSPGRTGADGAFAFPDATPSHTDLWVTPPEPRSAWRLEPPRALTRRAGEVVELQRRDDPLVDLTVAVVDGRDGTPVSPTEVVLRRLFGSSENWDAGFIDARLSLGAATAGEVPAGRYRVTVRAGDGLLAEREFTLPPVAPTHTERVELWPAAAVVCTVDASALPRDELLRPRDRTVLVLLDCHRERSYFVGEDGERRDYTPNTGAIRFGAEQTFRLERVTPNVALRLYVPHDDLFGEVWFTAAPGETASVTLRLVPFGRLAVELPATWPSGHFEIDVHDGAAWRLADSGAHGDDGPGRPQPLPRPAGEVRWRVRLWPADGGAVVERTGTTAVPAGGTAHATFD